MKHKADDSSFENYYLNMSLDFQNSHKDLFNKVSELMPEKEKMDLILSLKNNYSTNPILSRKQIRTISDALGEYNSWNTQIMMILKKFIQILKNFKK